ncbi:MAG: serine/threonine-protein kinase [Deltaproteobacteria bacterium]|nr:serine/threonine-protein kinase [Deltaproteobacteria bacterium]
MSTAAEDTTGLLLDCEPRQADVGGRLAVHNRLFPRKGLQLDRYAVLRRVGRGGMGHVFEAHDPKLQRSVAIKLLRPGPGLDQSSALLSEARAMAQLRHPNVVPVYDVGQADGQVFIVMEFVQGVDLAAWLGGRHRRSHQVLRLFRDAARGLAAAHRAGLVHRDFKPSNVLVDQDGRALVTDFGVAIRVEDEQGIPHYAGTPRYTAPEVAAGAAPTPASDQYSFCLALREALDTLEGRTDWRVRRARSVVRRGLSADPTRRWPSMEALIGRLDPIPRRFAASASLVGSLCGSVATIGVIAEPDPCVELVASIDDDWSKARGVAVHDALASKFGDDTRIDRAVAALDEYADVWRAEAASSCTAGPVEPTSLVHACLLASRQELANAADYLEDRSDDAARMLDAVPRPQDILRCAGWGVLVAPDDAGAVAEAELQLASVRSKLRVGQPWALVPELERLSAHADTLGHPPLQAHVLLTQGRAQHQAGSPRDAITTWMRAFDEALAGGDLGSAFDIAAELAGAHADTHIQQPAQARRWARHARALGRRHEISLSRLAAVDLAEGTALSLEHDHEAAIALLRGAVAQINAHGRNDIKGTSRRLAATGYERLAAAHHAAGNPQDARSALDAARRQMHEVLGEDHPELIRLYVTGAAIAGASGDLETAAQELDQAQRLAATLKLAADPRTLELHVNRAELEVRRGDTAEAVAAAAQAVDVALGVPGLHADRLALALIVHGSMLQVAGRMPEARVSAKRAVAAAKDDPRVMAGARWLLGTIELNRGDAAAALLAYRAAGRIEDREGVEAPNRAHIELAILELRAGHHTRARARITLARRWLAGAPMAVQRAYGHYLELSANVVEAAIERDRDAQAEHRAQLEALLVAPSGPTTLFETLLPARSSDAWAIDTNAASEDEPPPPPASDSHGHGFGGQDNAVQLVASTPRRSSNRTP